MTSSAGSHTAASTSGSPLSPIGQGEPACRLRVVYTQRERLPPTCFNESLQSSTCFESWVQRMRTKLGLGRHARLSLTYDCPMQAGPHGTDLPLETEADFTTLLAFYQSALDGHLHSRASTFRITVHASTTTPRPGSASGPSGTPAGARRLLSPRPSSTGAPELSDVQQQHKPLQPSRMQPRASSSDSSQLLRVHQRTKSETHVPQPTDTSGCCGEGSAAEAAAAACSIQSAGSLKSARCSDSAVPSRKLRRRSGGTPSAESVPSATLEARVADSNDVLKAHKSSGSATVAAAAAAPPASPPSAPCLSEPVCWENVLQSIVRTVDRHHFGSKLAGAAAASRT